jgi:hypothetical protein
VSDAWTYWLEYNLPPIAICLAFVIWGRRQWKRQAERVEANLALLRENNELQRQTVALLEGIREALKGKP